VRFNSPRRGVSNPSVLCHCHLVVVCVGVCCTGILLPSSLFTTLALYRVVGPSRGGGHPTPHLYVARIPGLKYLKPTCRRGGRRYPPPLSHLIVIVAGSAVALLLLLAPRHIALPLLLPLLMLHSSSSPTPPPPPHPLFLFLLLFALHPSSSSLPLPPPPLRPRPHLSLLHLLLILVNPSSFSIVVVVVDYCRHDTPRRRLGPGWWPLSLESMKEPAHIPQQRGGAR